MICVRKTELTTPRFPGMRIRSKLLAKLLLASSWDFLAKGFWSNCFETFASFFPSPLQLKTFVSSFPSISAPPTADQGAVLWDFLGGSKRLLPKLPNAHFHSFQPLTLPTPTQSTSEERADSEKLFSKSAEERQALH